MGSGKKLNESEKVKISTLKDYRNMSNRQIAKEVSRSEKVVRNFLKNRQIYGKTPVSGRPPVVTVAEKRKLLRVASNNSASAREIRDESGVTVSVRRVQQILHDSSHLKHKKMKKKPMLSKDNIEQRLKFAISHMSWTQEWRKIIFSDEKKFNLDGPDGWACYWHDLRKEPRYFSKRQSGGGSVMVWGAIGYKKKFDLIFVDTRMDAKKYQDMIGPLFPAWGYEAAGLNWKFQQDNAPIHVAKSTLKYFKDRNIHLFTPWPAKSPDMNIIENLWGFLAKDVYASGRQYKKKEDLKEAIISSWKNIDQDKIRNLYSSLPRRMRALYDSKGKHTRY